MTRRIVHLACAGALVSALAGGSEAPAASPTLSPTFDACRLLAPAEVAAVQEAAVTRSQGSQRAANGFLIAQCYYLLAPGDRSVSLEVTLRDPSHPHPASPSRLWRQSFHPESGRKDKDREEEEEEREAAAPPRPVPGLGEEAFWTGGQAMGALYVRAGDRFFRISLGGLEDAAVKTEKSRSLAAKILGRW
jgi:hypothetical protein